MLGLVLPSACIFLEGRVFLWELPKLDTHASWPGWNNDHFKLFEVVVPRPGKMLVQVLYNPVQVLTRLIPTEILLLGTGDHAVMPPPHVKKYLNDLGIQLDVMNSVCCPPYEYFVASLMFSLIVECKFNIQHALRGGPKGCLCYYPSDS